MLDGLWDTHLFGVCDGHGIYGKEVSSTIKQILPQYLKKNLGNVLRTSGSEGASPGDVWAGLIKTFKEVNEFLFTSDIDILLSGSTCNIVLVVKDRVYTANVGDSRAVLYKD